MRNLIIVCTTLLALVACSEPPNNNQDAEARAKANAALTHQDTEKVQPTTQTYRIRTVRQPGDTK